MSANKILPFRFWCQKVLPLIYDDSLSYLEVLCKVTAKLNELVKVDNQQNEAIQALQEDVSQLEYYLEELRGCIALEYDSNNSYSEGMYCIFNGDLYVCEESTTGEFDRNAWLHTNLGDELSNTNHNLSLLDNRVQFTESEIERINESITTINSRIENIITELAPTYDANRTYSEGEYCTFLRDLYVCTATTTGEFDRACWDGTDVGFELYQLRQETERIDTAVNAFQRALENIREQLITLTNNFASEYAENTYYNVGQYCVYNDILYKCVEAIPNPSGEFDPLKWTRTKVSIELVDVQDECSNIRLALDGLVVNFMGNLALPFSNYEGTTVTYNTGDFVTDYQWLYKCIQGYSFNEVVPTPANDRVHWVQTTITDNLSSGGGGGGDANIIPSYDPAYDYAMYELMERNDTTYMCIAHYATIGSFVPSEWFEIPVKDVLRWSMFNAIGANGLFDPNDVYPKGKLYGELYTDTDGRQCMSVQKVLQDWDGQGTPISDSTSLVEIMNESLWVMSNYNRDTYDPTKTYNAGDIIINYAGRCMRCNTNGTTGTFDILKWDDTDMFTELARIKNAMINLNLYNGNIVDRFTTNVTEGV